MGSAGARAKTDGCVSRCAGLERPEEVVEADEAGTSPSSEWAWDRAGEDGPVAG